MIEMRSHLFSVLLLLLFSGCSNDPANNKNFGATTYADSVKQANNIQNAANRRINSGELLFKNNCAVCHAAPSANGENGQGIRTFFRKLPTDSLQYVMDFISKGRKVQPQHVFRDSLTEEEVQDIILYTWAISRQPR